LAFLIIRPTEVRILPGLPDSAKASAALSRRCLQSIIRDKAAIKRPNLSKEIDDLLASYQ